MTAVDVENPGPARAAQVVAKAGALPGDWIARRDAGEWKNVGRIEERGVRLRVARRLREAMIEASAARSGSVCEETIECNASALVGVEALIEEVTDESSRLGHAVADSESDVRHRRRIVLEIGHHVAHSGEPGAHDDRVLGPIHDFVDSARGKSPLHVDPPRIAHDGAAAVAREAPLASLNNRARTNGIVAHSENVRWVVLIRDRIRERRRETVPERDRSGGAVDRDVAADESGDRLLGGPRRGRLKVESASSGRYIPLPPHRDDRDAAFHQQRIAVEFRGLRRCGAGAAEIEDEGRDSAAVDDVDDREVGRARRILRAQHHELAHGLHFAIRIPRREIDIDDAAIFRILRIEREVHASRDPLVGARASECAGDVGAREDLDSDHAGVGGSREESQT